MSDQVQGGWTHRDTTILAMITARCWRYADYRAEVTANPRAVLADEGLRLPEGLELRVVESIIQVDPDAGPDVRYVIIPPAPSGTDLDETVESELLRLAAGAGLVVMSPRNRDISPSAGPASVAAVTIDVAAQVGAVTAIGEAVFLATSAAAAAEVFTTVVSTIAAVLT
jgi:Nitrile hydratase, alpha chain